MAKSNNPLALDFSIFYSFIRDLTPLAQRQPNHPVFSLAQGRKRPWARALGAALLGCSVLLVCGGLAWNSPSENVGLLQREWEANLIYGAAMGMMVSGVMAIMFGSGIFGKGIFAFVLIWFGILIPFGCFGLAFAPQYTREVVTLSPGSGGKKYSFDLPKDWVMVYNKKHSLNQGTILDARESARLHVFLGYGAGKRVGKLVETRECPIGKVEMRSAVHAERAPFLGFPSAIRDQVKCIQWRCFIKGLELDFTALEDQQEDLLPVVWRCLESLRSQE